MGEGFCEWLLTFLASFWKCQGSTQIDIVTHHLLLDLAIINIAVFILSRNHFWPLASLAPLKSWIWQLDKCRETIWSWRRHRYPCFARAPQIIIDDPSMSSSPFIMQSIIAIALLFFCFCVPFLLKMWVTIAEEVNGIIGNWRVS